MWLEMPLYYPPHPTSQNLTHKNTHLDVKLFIFSINFRSWPSRVTTHFKRLKYILYCTWSVIFSVLICYCELTFSNVAAFGTGNPLPFIDLANLRKPASVMSAGKRVNNLSSNPIPGRYLFLGLFANKACVMASVTK